MNILFHKKWQKGYDKLSLKVQKQVDKRILLFVGDPSHPLLNNHPLNGSFKGCWSINVTGDYRAVYKEAGKDTFKFVAIGTHSELYS